MTTLGTPYKKKDGRTEKGTQRHLRIGWIWQKS